VVSYFLSADSGRYADTLTGHTGNLGCRRATVVSLFVVQGSVRIQDSGVHENKIGVELVKEAGSESELNSVYLTQLLHTVDRSLVLTLTVVRRHTHLSSSFPACTTRSA